MALSDIGGSSSLSLPMQSSDSQKEKLCNFLLQKFVKGDDSVTTSEDLDVTFFKNARRFLNVAPTDFNQCPVNIQKSITEGGADALIKVLQCNFEEPMLNGLVNALSPKVAEVLTGQSETLRPVLDYLIKQGKYSDPDLKPKLIQTGGKPIGVADSERAWRVEYQGMAHRTLLENIQRSFQLDTPYANSGSIIQSSGYGKSRTVDKMAMLIPTIPMNVRPRRETAEGAFPPTDTTLVQMFKRLETVDDDPLKCLLFFFKELFRLVLNLAQRFKPGDLTKNLYEHFSDQERRIKFYTDLTEIMKHPCDIRTEEAVASFEELAKILPPSEGPVKMVIYIDEAHGLADLNTEGSSMYDHVLKATAGFASVGVFFLFLSTASRLEVLASQATLSNSARFQGAKDFLVAPFTEMPFDCHSKLVNEGIQPGMMLKEIQKFSFAVQFGRPLFWAYYESMRIDQGESGARKATVAIAQAKLLANKTLTLPQNPGKLAILDTLLNLEYDPRRTQSHQLASTMVASHLRTVYSVPPSRAYMHTGYPSEPVLAEAALSFINSHYMPAATPFDPLLSLYSMVDANTAGAIDKGERGENMGKLILLLAYIAAVKKHSESEPNQQFWGDGCSLLDFVTELTGDKYCADVLVSIPDNIHGGLPLKEAFKNSWVRFTHFARAADDSAMSTSVALVAFIRGMAMIGWHSQVAVDVNIPILLDKDKPITESNMTSILVQFKVRTARTAQDKVAVDAEAIQFFPPPESCRDDFADRKVPEHERNEYYARPYISLVMELGVVAPSDRGSIRHLVMHLLDKPRKKPSASKKKQKSSQKPKIPVSQVHTGGSQLPASARKLRARPKVPVTTTHGQSSSSPTSKHSTSHIHPRYSLFYYGCSHKVYQCIRDTDEDACRTLLQIPTVFNDRPENRPIDPVLQLKPFWSAGKNCYSWIRVPYLNQEYRESTLKDDQVLVGYPMDVEQDPDAMDETL